MDKKFNAVMDDYHSQCDQIATRVSDSSMSDVIRKRLTADYQKLADAALVVARARTALDLALNELRRCVENTVKE